MAKQKIRTYSTETFRSSYMKPQQELDRMLKDNFGKFFVVRVEDLIRLIRLPVPPVRSTTHTLIYLTSGEASMIIGSQSYTIYKDECLVVPAGQVYSFARHDKNTGYLCNFHSDFIADRLGKKELVKVFGFLNVWANPRIRLGKSTSGLVMHLFRRLLADYSVNALTNSDLLRSYFIALLCELNLVYKSLENGADSASHRLTAGFKELLFRHLKQVHAVSEYAARLHVSPNHLNKTVKSTTGRSPIKWIDEALVLEAKILLYQTTLSVSDIASEIGIHDASYFSRLFKKHEKVTPLQFRKMIEKS